MFFVVQQGQQQPGAAAESAKEGSLADARRVGDGIHGHALRADLVQDLTCGFQQANPVASGDSTLPGGILRKVDRKQGYFLTRHNALILAAGNQTDHGPYCKR
ncbi:hypothetical protein NJBCHELONAE_26170 [Mycobacteroides chelonae]|nr:hypothetical protein NJBCHELONAE_26170 [Mycobacteroides chelonae]